MDPAALAGLCALLARGEAAPASVSDAACPAAQVVPASRAPRPNFSLGDLVRGPVARDAIARVAFAEAGNQGDSGLAGVVYTILNRLQDGRWGASVDSVLNARSQFEPVMRAGGDWRRLPAVSPAAQARVDTILNLALEGRLPDLTNGARFFQNPAIVGRRAIAATVPASLVDFGGSPPSAMIGAHRFYVETGRGGGHAATVARARHDASQQGRAEGLFIGENRTPPSADGPPSAPWSSESLTGPQGDPGRALFVTASGRVRADRP